MSSTNGKMSTFLRIVANLLRAIVELADDFLNLGVDFLISKDVFSRVHEQNVQTFLNVESVLLFSPAFSDTSLEKVTLYCSFE
jgi:hypothetical protein